MPTEAIRVSGTQITVGPARTLAASATTALQIVRDVIQGPGRPPVAHRRIAVAREAVQLSCMARELGWHLVDQAGGDGDEHTRCSLTFELVGGCRRAVAVAGFTVSPLHHRRDLRWPAVCWMGCPPFRAPRARPSAWPGPAQLIACAGQSERPDVVPLDRRRLSSARTPRRWRWVWMPCC